MSKLPLVPGRMPHLIWIKEAEKTGVKKDRSDHFYDSIGSVVHWSKLLVQFWKKRKLSLMLFYHLWLCLTCLQLFLIVLLKAF